MPQLFPAKLNTVAKLSLILGGALPVLLILGGSAVSRSGANTGVGVAPDQPIPFSHKHHAYELGIDCRYCHTSVEKSSYAGIPQSETCMSCHSVIWTNSPLLEPVRQSYATGKPLKWTKVNKVPEFVYFNHSIHINRGLNCNTCHGKINGMQMTSKGRAFFMEWCLDCHRHPEKFLYTDSENAQMSPRQQVFNLYLKLQSDPKGDNMSRQEKRLIEGLEPVAVTQEEIDHGKELVAKYGVKTAQLEDCWTCHR